MKQSFYCNIFRLFSDNLHQNQNEIKVKVFLSFVNKDADQNDDRDQ